VKGENFLACEPSTFVAPFPLLQGGRWRCELAKLYNDSLNKHLTPEQLQKVREAAGVAADAPVPRLKGNEPATAPKQRYNAEMAFYMDAENQFYQDMSGYLRKTLGVRQPIIGTAAHSHTSARIRCWPPYPSWIFWTATSIGTVTSPW
jgi:hypothetical protein